MKNSATATIIYIVIGIVIVAAATWGAISLLSRHAPAYSDVTVSRRDMTETVTATGNVTATQNVMLAFNMQGKVAAVYTDVGSTTRAGQVLASLDAGTLQAQLAGAQADVKAAQAKLSEMQSGTRPEELLIYQQKFNDTSSALVSAMKNAYLQTEGAILNTADNVFTNGSSPNPTINIHTESQFAQISIDNERLTTGDSLNSWKSTLASLGSSATSTAALNQARSATTDALTAAKSFLDHLGTIVAKLSPGNSGLTQSAIDADVAAVNSAAQQVTAASTAEQAADAAWSSASDTLALENAGSTSEDVQAQQAAVDKANAAVAGLVSQLRQSTIVSPFDGVVTAMNVKVGEIYVPGISADEGIGLISNGAFKLETYVPETDIGKLAVGDPVTVTFDAYGPNTAFPATITLVDPAETVRNGVNAYKVTISFNDPSDARIKSGLTANASITAATTTGTLAVPTRAIITRGSSKFVLVKKAGSDTYSEQQTTLGISSADGYTQVLSGVNEGDVIAGFGTY